MARRLAVTHVPPSLPPCVGLWLGAAATSLSTLASRGDNRVRLSRCPTCRPPPGSSSSAASAKAFSLRLESARRWLRERCVVATMPSTSDSVSLVGFAFLCSWA